MKIGQFSNVQDVAAWRLCSGCGACAHACPERAVCLVDFIADGIRPVVDNSRCERCGRCMDVCPGVRLTHTSSPDGLRQELRAGWGPALDMYEGYASDPEIRFKGSSGGAATALALYCLEHEQSPGVLHIGPNGENPLHTTPVFSTNRESILSQVGSRYCPAAPCAALDQIKGATGPCVFIGKPCDVAAVEKARRLDPDLDRNILLTIGIFCAGTPSSAGTQAVLEELGVASEQVTDIRYRGCGWPGKTSVRTTNAAAESFELSYERSWGDILSKHVPLRCRLCPDGTGEFADIACGDAWYRTIEPGDSGWSLVLARTPRGRVFVQEAVSSGYLKMQKVSSDILERSQEALLRKRRNLWGRLVAMRSLGIPIPRFDGFDLFGNWRRLGLSSKLRSVLGTYRRGLQRQWRRPVRRHESGRNLRDACEELGNREAKPV